MSVAHAGLRLPQLLLGGPLCMQAWSWLLEHCNWPAARLTGQSRCAWPHCSCGSVSPWCCRQQPDNIPPAFASAVGGLLELRAQNLEVAIHGQVSPPRPKACQTLLAGVRGPTVQPNQMWLPSVMLQDWLLLLEQCLQLCCPCCVACLHSQDCATIP